MINANKQVSFIPNLFLLSASDIKSTRTFCYERAEVVNRPDAKAFWIKNAVSCTEVLRTIKQVNL